MKLLLLAGGTGTRLWPLSRKETPKQFLKLPNLEHSLFQMTLDRAKYLADDKDIYVITREETKYLALQQINELGLKIPEDHIILQYSDCNTLPIVYFAVNKIGKNNIYLMLPSDHIIPKEEMHKLKKSVESGKNFCDKYLLVFGITPQFPHTGYGYIKPGKTLSTNTYEVEEFKEKPNKETATQYIKKGYLWNSGMLLFSGKVFIQEVQKHEPEIPYVFNKYSSPKEAFLHVKPISIDYGVLEKTSRIGVIKLDIKWSDVGDFKALLTELGDISNVNKLTIDSKNVLAISTSPSKKSICLIGIENIAVIDTPDSILVTDLDRSQDVRKLYDVIKTKLPELSHSWIEYRPWGKFQVIVDTDKFKIKKLSLLPKKRTSYQSHRYRDETWIILEGVAKIRVDDKESVLRKGQTIQIKRGQKHRIMNCGEGILEILEIQTGDYFGEDDITRYEDDWGRK